MTKILFITTANLSTNPRLFKEILLAERCGYKTAFVAFRLGGWSDEKDQVLIREINSTPYYLSALRIPYWPWLKGTVVHLLCRYLWPTFGGLWVAAMGHDKRTFRLMTFFSDHQKEYDLVIGHNLGSLYPAFRFAQKRNIPFAFDVEDYHPGEASTHEKGEIERRKLLMSQLLPNAAYYSYASPLIGRYTETLFSSTTMPTRLAINNCFSKDKFVPPSCENGKLKMVWFSQNISADRGLEEIIPIISQYKGRVSLSLIGHLNPYFFDRWIKPNRDFIYVHEPMGQNHLLSFLSHFDVGLAVEPGKDENNLLALSNKIWCYLQAGLFIFATDTPAQRDFMTAHPSHGVLVKNHKDALDKALHDILKQKEEMKAESLNRYQNAKAFCWENESEKLKQLWGEILLLVH